jgi:DNA-binding SARP family transcriptional activator
MAPDPREEGFGRRAGSVDLTDKLLIPKDPRGIVLACGFAALAAFGINALVSGDWIGFGYLLGAVIGYVFLQTRLVPTILWLAVAVGGFVGATAGNASAWIVVGFGAVLTVVSLLRPSEVEERRSSRNLEVRAGQPETAPLPASPVEQTSSGNLELVGTETSANGTGSAADPMDPAGGAVPSAESTRHRIALRAIGTLCIEVDGRDQTRRLRDQPRLEFLLSYLLARKVCEWEAAVDRSAIAEEIAPGYEPPVQRDRLRKTLHALKAALGTDLRGLVRVSGSQFRLDLAEVDFDVAALVEMSARVNRRHGLIDTALADEIRELLESTAGGEFLAGFSELEHHVTEGKGAAADLIEQARVQVSGRRADLTSALARHLEAAGRPQSSIAYLRSALSQSPRREDLARLLLAAYLQTGQTARAEEIRLEYELA